jgi:effector-binding domain-containing protein
MTYKITERMLVDQPTAACRATLRADRVGPWLAETYALIGAFLQRLPVAMVGPPYARYTFHEGQMDIEAGFPVAREIHGEGPIQPSHLPGGPAAVTVHLGPYETLEDAYKAVMGWLVEQGYEAAGSHWELYYTDPDKEPDRSKWRTEVVAPFRRGGSPFAVGTS